MSLTDNSGERTSGKEVIIVTGSSGLIGTSIIKRLSEKYRLVGLDNTGYPFPPKEAECVCYDITSEDSIRAALERVRYGYGDKIASVIRWQPTMISPESPVRCTKR